MADLLIDANDDDNIADLPNTVQNEGGNENDVHSGTTGVPKT